MRNNQIWANSDLKLEEHSLTKGLPRENNRTIENFFSPKDVSYNYIISLKVTKFQQPLLITLGVAVEKPEGRDRVNPIQAGGTMCPPTGFFLAVLKRLAVV